MVRRGKRNEALTPLRRVFGDEAAEVLAGALMPDGPVDVSGAPAGAPEPDKTEAPWGGSGAGRGTAIVKVSSAGELF